jgi:hypothetical protein
MYNEQSQLRSDRAAAAFMSRAETLSLEEPEAIQADDDECDEESKITPLEKYDKAIDSPESNAMWTACDKAMDMAQKSADTRDYGLEIPEDWYQSPLWRKEMMDNLKASMAGDFAWLDKKFAEYKALALAYKLEKQANAYKAQGLVFIGAQIMGRAMGLRDDVKNGRIEVKK